MRATGRRAEAEGKAGGHASLKTGQRVTLLFRKRASRRPRVRSGLGDTHLFDHLYFPLLFQLSTYFDDEEAVPLSSMRSASFLMHPEQVSIVAPFFLCLPVLKRRFSKQPSSILHLTFYLTIIVVTAITLVL
jgi:hypothetical protein